MPLRLDLRPLDRLPAPVEAAAYRVVADCVRAAERAGGRAVALELTMTEQNFMQRCGSPACRRPRRGGRSRIVRPRDAVGGELTMDGGRRRRSST